MKSFRFIHTADIHLDSPLIGLAGQEGGAADRIRTATREAFKNLVGLALHEEAAFVIIAGDLYDGDWRDYQTGLLFVRKIGRLVAAGIQVFLLYGNHDAEGQITRRLVLPENVNAFSSRKPVTFQLKEFGIALHGQSYRQRDIADNLVPAYPEPIAGCSTFRACLPDGRFRRQCAAGSGSKAPPFTRPRTEALSPRWAELRSSKGPRLSAFSVSKSVGSLDGPRFARLCPLVCFKPLNSNTLRQRTVTS